MKPNTVVHFSHPLYPSRTVCGAVVNGYTIGHATYVSDVTCKRCLKWLSKRCVCPKCGTVFLRQEKET